MGIVEEIGPSSLQVSIDKEEEKMVGEEVEEEVIEEEKVEKSSRKKFVFNREEAISLGISNSNDDDDDDFDEPAPFSDLTEKGAIDLPDIKDIVRKKTQKE